MWSRGPRFARAVLGLLTLFHLNHEVEAVDDEELARSLGYDNATAFTDSMSIFRRQLQPATWQIGEGRSGCPTYNNQEILSPDGTEVWRLRCNTDHDSISDVRPESRDMATCITWCQNTPYCDAVVHDFGGAGTCYSKRLGGGSYRTPSSAHMAERVRAYDPNYVPPAEDDQGAVFPATWMAVPAASGGQGTGCPDYDGRYIIGPGGDTVWRLRCNTDNSGPNTRTTSCSSLPCCVDWCAADSLCDGVVWDEPLQQCQRKRFLSQYVYSAAAGHYMVEYVAEVGEELPPLPAQTQTVTSTATVIQTITTTRTTTYPVIVTSTAVRTLFASTTQTITTTRTTTLPDVIITATSTQVVPTTVITVRTFTNTVTSTITQVFTVTVSTTLFTTSTRTTSITNTELRTATTSVNPTQTTTPRTTLPRATATVR